LRLAQPINWVRIIRRLDLFLSSWLVISRFRVKRTLENPCKSVNEFIMGETVRAGYHQRMHARSYPHEHAYDFADSGSILKWRGQPRCC